MASLRPEFHTEAQCLARSEKFLAAKKELIRSLEESSAKIRGVRPASGTEGARQAYSELITRYVSERGRELYFPFLGSGIGSGPYVELMDGSVKMDLITGIGINFFGHSNPEMISEMIDGIAADPMQGNLQPGVEAHEFSEALLSRLGGGSRLRYVWPMCSGTMVNEVALKIIRQKRAPATRVFAFEDCFAGRSTAMQELTDNPKYREGQPVYGEVFHLPFYSKTAGLERSLTLSLGRMREEIKRYPNRYAALMIELVQGEGGFNFAPREFYVALFEEAKRAGIAVWVDEIQTFGRTGELFAYQKFNLNEWVDVVTVGKMLQACAVIFSEEYNPKPGLVAGTFTGSTAALRTARKTLELLSDGYFGADGKIERLSSRFVRNLNALADGECKGMISDVRAIGGMIAFSPFSGTMDEVKSSLLRFFDNGVIAFQCGHGPYSVRLLPPLGAMTDADVDVACRIMGECISAIGAERRLS
ncbi:MAG: hypothetical protein A2X94_09685 [Bdellovibrionales bacterium GWB1_55_8]|nr:MAG: hypothetical protein A2X94_09685 [Bdellovibrionales bacterium GWB1_55_8]